MKKRLLIAIFFFGLALAGLSHQTCHASDNGSDSSDAGENTEFA